MRPVIVSGIVNEELKHYETNKEANAQGNSNTFDS